MPRKLDETIISRRTRRDKLNPSRPVVASGFGSCHRRASAENGQLLFSAASPHPAISVQPEKARVQND